MIKYYISIFMLILLNYNLYGQEINPIEADRPDQTETPSIVPKGYFQIESGISYEKNGDEENFLYPSVLWKYGLTDRLELRIITELETNHKDNKSTTEVSPIAIGFKVNLWEEKGLIPTTSFIAHLSMSTLSTKKIKPTYYAPRFRFTMEHTLTKRISLAYNLGAEWDGIDVNPTFIYTLVTGFSLTEKLGAYTEIFGFAPQKNTADHRIAGGFSYHIRPNIMVDISSAWGITKNAPKFYSAIGFSIRLPN